MLYRVSFEFRLTRMRPWPADGHEFFGHTESVRTKIEAHEAVDSLRLVANREESSLTFDFLIDASEYQTALLRANELVRNASETAGARHFGIDVVGRFVSAGAGSGMDTPIWQRLRTLIDIAA